jgi:hypothetical protein
LAGHATDLDAEALELFRTKRTSQPTLEPHGASLGE